MKIMQIHFKSYNLCSRLLVILFSSCVFVGCGKNSSVNPKRISGRIIGSDNTDKAQAIVLIHGLEGYADLEEMRRKLASKFPNFIVVDLNRTDSGTSPIMQQAQDAFEELKRLNLLDKEMVLIGDSQGGLLGWELYNMYKKQLKVKLLITNHTPWEGAPIAAVTLEIMDQVKSKLCWLGNMLEKSIPNSPFENICSQSERIGHGVTDLKPNSPYLQQVRSNLLHADIPILAIGGTIDAVAGFSILVGLNPDDIKAHIQISGVDINVVRNIIEPIFSQVIGNKENDAFIPLDSQLAKHIPTNAQFKRITINDYHHFASIMEEPVYSLIVNTVQEAFQSAKPN